MIALQKIMPSPIIRTVLLVILCLPLSGFNEITHHSVDILPHWKRGDSFTLTITRAREKSVDGRSTISGTTRTHFAVEVLRADDEGYLVGWTAGETTFNEPAPSESFLRQVVGLMKGIQIVLQLDHHGTITGVQNWQELRRETVKVMDALLAKMPEAQKGSTESSLMLNFRAQWDGMFRTKEQVEQLCTRDAKAYFMALGRSYTPNKPLTFAEQLPNPLGGEPFPAHATIALKAFDKRSGQAFLTKRQTADPEQASRIMESMVKEMSVRQGKKPPERQLPNTIVIEDHAEIAVDVNTGWVTRLTRTQSMNLGTRSQRDTTTFVRSAN